MRPTRERLIELLATNDQYLLHQILEALDKQTALLEKLAGVSAETAEEPQKRQQKRKEA